MAVRDHLKLDVPGILHQLLEVNVRVAERLFRLGARGMEALDQAHIVVRGAHAASAAARAGLDHDGVPDLLWLP